MLVPASPFFLNDCAQKVKKVLAVPDPDLELLLPFFFTYYVGSM